MKERATDSVEKVNLEQDLMEEHENLDDPKDLDITKLYFKEISKYPLLTDEEVKECYRNLDNVSTIQILRESDIAHIKDIDLATIFKSCCNNDNYKFIIETLLEYYTKLHSNSSSGKYYYSELKKYMDISKEKNRPLTESELESNFDLDFKNAKNLSPKHLLVDVDNYLKCRDSYCKMFNSNLRLVVSIVYRQYLGTYEFLDLINEGNMGLMKAIEKFDISLGNRFSTYATLWIRQSVYRAIQNQKQNIRIPVHINDKLSKYRKQVRELEQEYGHKLEKSEISELLGYQIEEVDEYEHYITSQASLDQKVFDNSVETMKDFVKSDIDVTKEAMETMLSKDIFELLNCLSEREKNIIMKRFGFNENNEVITLEEIGKELNITRERVRQIEKKALRKIKDNTKKKNYTFSDLKI